MNIKKDIYWILLFTGLICIFFGQLLFTDITFVYRDFYRYFYPVRYFSTECIRNGILPLWNPYLYCGIPFFADLQSGVLYPLSIIYYLLCFDFGLKFFVVVHYWLAGIFMYLLMRDWGVEQMPALTAAIVYTFSGYLLSLSDLLTSLTSATWTPLIFFLFNRALNSMRFSYIVSSGAVMGLQFMGGEPTVLYTNLIALTLFTIAKASINENRKRILNIIIILPIAGLIGIGLILFQVLPFLELVSFSERAAGLEYRAAAAWSLAPYELTGLIVPFFSCIMKMLHVWDAQTWLKTIYFSSLSLLFIYIGIIHGRQRKILFWAGIFLLFILLSFGYYTPWYYFLYKYLPFLSSIRYPVKFFSMVTFAGAILVGLGINCLITKIKNVNMVSLTGFILIIITFIIIINSNWFLELVKGIYLYYTLSACPMEVFDNLFSSIRNNSYIVAIFLLLALLMIFLYKRAILRAIFIKPLIMTMIIIDLFYFGIGLSPLISEEYYHYIPNAVKYLKQDSDYYRILLSEKTLLKYPFLEEDSTIAEILVETQDCLLPAISLSYHLFDASGYGSLQINDYSTFLRLAKDKELIHDYKLEGMANVKYIISRLKLEGMPLVYADNEIKIYYNPDFLPRAFLVPNVVIIKDRKEVLRRMLTAEFNPRKEVILEEKITNKYQISNLKSQIKILDYQPNKVIIKASSNADCFLFLSDTYYPGWKAYIDGVETKIYRANYIFRAIKLPSGEHQVEFKYLPQSFKFGTWASIIIASFIIGFGVVKKYVKGKTK